MEITSNGVLLSPVSTKGQVPLCSGPPTRQELVEHYPARFTWEDLKTFVNSGDLGLLKRDRELQKRYDAWLVGIVQSYGSVVDYLMNHRLRWGQPDTLSLLKSDLVHNIAESRHSDITIPISSVIPPYFSWETPSQFISIIENDWPYSVPTEVEHTLVWTKMPIYHVDLVEETIKTRIDQDGLWGFTGNDLPPALPSNPSCISKLAEWGITMDNMVKSEPPTEEEKILLQKAGREVHRYVKNRWIEKEWETAWFVNPPRLQSVPGLAHIHVFARRN